jgi:hypothetical protein
MSGDTATWVDAAGTWVVGVVAGFIAWRQYDHSRFKPDVVAYFDGDGRIVVRITNKGAGAGSAEDIDLQPERDRESGQPVIPYHLEIDGTPAGTVGTTPFPLAGLDTVQVVLLPIDTGDITAETHVLVRYGNGKTSDPKPLNKVFGRMFGSTTIRPVS